MDANGGIKKLEIKNVKALKAVTIMPAGSMMVIAGLNGAGKSSVIDAIWFALGGTRVHDPQVIREGAKSGSVELTFNEWTVKRVWNVKGSHLEVRAPNSIVAKPQTFLDQMVGKRSLDPMRLLQLKGRDAVQALLEQFPVEIDGRTLDLTNSMIESLKADRKEAKAKRNATRNALDAITREDPGPRHDFAHLERELAELRSNSARVADLRHDLDRCERAKKFSESRIETLKTELADLEANVAALRDEMDAILGDISDLDEVTEEQIAGAETTLRQAIEHNALVDSYESATSDRRGLAEQAAEFAMRADELDDRVKALESAKREALASVEFPISGLAFNEDGVTYNGISLEQCAMSERMRVACAIAMHEAPPLKIIRVSDGSLLDEESMAELERIVAESGYQAWVERIDPCEGNGAHCVEIRDGEVVGEHVTDSDVAEVV